MDSFLLRPVSQQFLQASVFLFSQLLDKPFLLRERLIFSEGGMKYEGVVLNLKSGFEVGLLGLLNCFEELDVANVAPRANLASEQVVNAGARKGRQIGMDAHKIGYYIKFDFSGGDGAV